MNLKDKYINFFIEKGHKQIPSSPVVPEGDNTVLFTTAGMQPLTPYLRGETHPLGTRLVDCQKCIRTNDLDEVGDLTHHTFFEMLGNWSLGDYFKKESISYSFEFLTKVLNIPIERLAVTCFVGNDETPKDEESFKIWNELGIPKERIAFLGVDDNWWPDFGAYGLCGPDSEIFYFRSDDEIPEVFDPEDDRWVEIWNNVFMEYYHDENGYIPLEKKNVDTGMGVERVTAILEGVNDNYKSSIFKEYIELIEKYSGKSYEGNEKNMRIIADHVRTIAMILGENSSVKPSNTDQGYILRRLIRRVIRHEKVLGIDVNSDFLEIMLRKIVKDYKKYYKELEENEEKIVNLTLQEQQKFSKTIDKGLKQFEKVIKLSNKEISGKDAFHLYDTYGFPLELTVELAIEKGLKVDEDGFYKLFKEHQEKSRLGAQGKFESGLLSKGEEETKYHTATHLLNAALKIVLKDPNIHQKGSNITSERLRFDFNFDRKLTDEEKKQIEDLINKWISEDLKVTKVLMKKEQAVKTGAEASFIERYPDEVNVYSIGDVSKEICSGPHVKSTKELGTFKIKKEEASSSGIRRIKAILQ